MRVPQQLSRVAGEAGVLLIPLALLLAGLLIRLETVGGGRVFHPAAADLNMDVDVILRLLLAGSLAGIAALAVRSAVRRP